MENLYEVLNIPDFSSHYLVKSRFQQLAKKFHPDKRVCGETDTGNQSVTSEQCTDFLKIKSAWDVLGDLTSKVEYDINLKQSQAEQEFTINDFVCLKDFDIKNYVQDSTCTSGVDHDVYVYECRCGGVYELSKKDFEKNKVSHSIVGCSNCSLYIQVQFEINQPEI